MAVLLFNLAKGYFPNIAVLILAIVVVYIICVLIMIKAHKFQLFMTGTSFGLCVFEVCAYLIFKDEYLMLAEEYGIQKSTIWVDIICLAFILITTLVIEKLHASKEGYQFNPFLTILTSSQNDYEPKKETEVYKEHYHDGWVDRTKMKVNSTGDMYYDPDDASWHKISDLKN